MILRGLLLAVAVLVVVQVGVLAYHLALTIAFPYDLNYGEGYVLFDAVRFSRGEQVYVDVQQFPMVRSPYPPLFPLLWSAVVPFAGPVFWPGRALSVVALTGLGVLVGVNAWRVRCGVWPGVVAIGLLAGSPFVYQWAGYARVDLLALLFATAGVVVAQASRGRWGLAGAALLCGLAMWTKQTAITATIAVAVALSLRSWRTGAAFVLLVGAPSLLVLAWLNVATDGQFARHVLAGNATNPVVPLRATIFVGTFLALHLPAVAASLWWLRRALTRTPSPLAVYLPIALFAALSSGNGGSSVNYLLEPLVALALAVPFAWRALPPAAIVVGPLLAATQLVLLLHWPNTFGATYLGDQALGRTPGPADAAIGARLDELVQSEAGEIIAEPAGFAVRNGRAVYVQPIDLRAEQLLGRWRSEPLTDALGGGRFSLVISAYNLFPVEAERAIQQHFTLAETLASPDGLTFQVYRYQASDGSGPSR